MRRSKSICLLILLIFQLTLHGCAKGPGGVANSSQTSSATGKVQSDIKSAAEASANAFVHKDFATVADYTYDPLVQQMGGKAVTISTVEGQLKDLEKKGMTIVSITVADPEPVNNIDNLQFSIVPTTVKMRYKDATVVSESFMIGVSDDGGQHWRFVDGAIAQDQELMKDLFGDAADKLRLPRIKEPVISD
jgi:hypothetical protein